MTQCKKYTHSGGKIKNTMQKAAAMQNTHTHTHTWKATAVLPNAKKWRQQKKDPMQKTHTVEARTQYKKHTHTGGNSKKTQCKNSQTQWRQLQGFKVKTSHTVEVTSRTQCKNHTHSGGNFKDSM